MVDKIKRNIVEDSAVTQPKLATGAVDSNALNTTATLYIRKATSFLEGK